jgi:hypothetical protein
MPRRIGRPGLIGTMARTAVIAGTATATSQAVSKKMSGGQNQQTAEPAPQQPVAAPAPQQPVAAAPAQPVSTGAPQANEITDDVIAQVEKLSSLRQAGALTDEEFTAAKARLLGL